MSADPRRRQKKLERRAARRKTKHHEIARARSAGLPERLAEAGKCPVLDCWFTPTFDDEGIGQLGLSRRLPTGDVAVAIFLTDRYCLGVKSTIVEIMPPSRYEGRILQPSRRDMGAVPLDPPSLRKMVEGAVDYARQLGLSPDPDYARGRLLFGDIDPTQAQRDCEYGKDGKPYFFAGPNDTPERCRMILRILREACGPNGFHYVIPIGSEFRERAAEFPEAIGVKPAPLTDDFAGAELPDSAPPDAIPPDAIPPGPPPPAASEPAPPESPAAPGSELPSS